MSALADRLFGPDAEQDALLEAAGPVFAAAAARAGADPAAPGPGWRVLAEAGLFGALLDPERDGLGLGCSALAGLTERAARALVPGPLVETAWIGVPALAADRASGELLDRVLAGSAVCTAADPAGRAPDLDRAHALVVPGARADVLLDVADLPEPSRVRTADRLERSFRVPAGTAPAGRAVAPLLGVGAETLGRLGGAASLLGIAGRMLDTAAAHASRRVQFGVPVGSFQAVRHRLADVYVEIDLARSAVQGAAAGIDRGAPGSATAVVCAAVVARRAAAAAERHGLQTLGGLGFTWEHELHVLAKRGQTFAHRFGSRRALEQRLGARLLDEAAAGPRVTPPRPHI